MAEGLGIAGSVVGIISFGIQITQGLLKYYGSWKDQDRTVADMCLSLQNLSTSLRVLQETIEAPAAFEQSVKDSVEMSVSSVDGSMKKLENELAKVRATATRSAMRRHVQRALYPFREETLNTIRRVVADARQNLSISLQVLQIQSVLETRQMVHQLVRWQEDNETRAILCWLSPHNFWLRQTDLLNQRQPGTGQWLLQDSNFLEWAQGSKGKIWCQGGPGVGKTVLASAVIEFLETDLPNQGTALAFIYCDHKNNQSQTMQYFVGAIVRQLVERQPDIPEHVRTLYQKHRGKGTNPTLAEYTDSLRLLAKECTEVYIVIDALDECIDKEGHAMWGELLIALQAPISNMHLLYTSRDIHDTTGILKDSTVIPIIASGADIRIYVEGQLQSKSVLLQFCRQDPALENEILHSIVSKSDGMFLAAKLYLDSLACKTNCRAVKKALSELPATLDNCYDDAMARIKKQPTETLALRVLAWVVYAMRPLHLGEVQHAIAVDELEPDDKYVPDDALTPPGILVNACAGLVKIDQASNIIGLVHKTTQEYFDRSGSEYFPQVQKDIATTCLNYLSLQAFGEGSCLTNGLYEQRLSTHHLFQYAAQNLGHHSRKMSERSQHISISTLFLSLDQANLSSMAQGLMMVNYTSRFLYCESFPRNFGIKHYAAYFGLEVILRLLIENCSVDLDLKDSYSRTPLSWAAERGHNATVQFLLEKGADIESWDNSYKRTPLSWAVKCGHNAVVQFLLENGADTESKDINGQTPLIWAAKYGQDGVVKLLLENISDTESEDINRQTPLILAAKCGQDEVVKLLLENGADTESKDINRQTPLIWAAKCGHEVVIKLLLENGADTESKDNSGQTPLIWAAKYGQDGVELLLENISDTESKDINKQTPLIWAAKCGQDEVVKLLLENGADIESKDDFGQTPLSWAAYYGYETVVKLLLENGADVKSKDEKGQTPPDVAVHNSYQDIVGLLSLTPVPANTC